MDSSDDDDDDENDDELNDDNRILGLKDDDLDCVNNEASSVMNRVFMLTETE